jgi:hypothetical protein
VLIYIFQTMKKPRRSSIDVQRPIPFEAPPITRSDNRVRSVASRLRKDKQRNQTRFDNYLKYAQKITLPVTLEKLSKPLSKKGLLKLENIADNRLGPTQPARCTSAQYFDKNGKPLLFYFGKRLVYDEKKIPVRPLPLPCLYFN